MPRTKKRFSFLERALKAAGGAANVSGGVLLEYAKFEAGDPANKPTRRNTTTVNRKRVGYALLPFSAPMPTTAAARDEYRAPISINANQARLGWNLSNVDLGYRSYRAGQNSGVGFYPAVARVSITAGTATPVTSGITKRPYSYKPTRSYGIPFGRHGATVERQTLFAQQQAIQDAVKAANPTGASISYLPEEFLTEGADLPEGTAVATTPAPTPTPTP